jgi:hypothetical protein
MNEDMYKAKFTVQALRDFLREKNVRFTKDYNQKLLLIMRALNLHLHENEIDNWLAGRLPPAPTPAPPHPASAPAPVTAVEDEDEKSHEDEEVVETQHDEATGAGQTGEPNAQQDAETGLNNGSGIAGLQLEGSDFSNELNRMMDLRDEYFEKHPEQKKHGYETWPDPDDE